MLKNIKDLRLHPENEKIYGNDVSQDLVDSIQSKGILTPLLISEDGRIISGNSRFKAASQLGFIQVPVTLFHSTDELEILEAVIESNRQRVKTNVQLMNEVVVLKHIESERARVRQLAAQNNNAGRSVQMNSSELQDAGQARDKVASSLGIGVQKVDRLITINDVVTELKSQGNNEAAEMLLETLEKKSVNAAINQTKEIKKAEEEKQSPTFLNAWYDEESSQDDPIFNTNTYASPTAPLPQTYGLEEDREEEYFTTGDDATYNSNQGKVIPIGERSIQHNSSGNTEWYTPKQFTDAARDVLGTIDLDPASNAEAQKWIKADEYYSSEKKQDGLKLKWYGNIWLNPPYKNEGGNVVSSLWGERLIREYRSGDVKSAILLITSVVDRVWFQKFWQFPIFFYPGRIKFQGPEGSTASMQPVDGNAFIYFGCDYLKFKHVFAQFGNSEFNFHWPLDDNSIELTSDAMYKIGMDLRNG